MGKIGCVRRLKVHSHALVCANEKEWRYEVR